MWFYLLQFGASLGRGYIFVQSFRHCYPCTQLCQLKVFFLKLCLSLQNNFSCFSFQIKVLNVKTTNLSVKMVIASQADGAVMVFPIAVMDQMKSTVYLPLQQVSLLQDQVHFQHQPQAQSQFLKVAKKINSNAKMENAST